MSPVRRDMAPPCEKPPRTTRAAGTPASTSAVMSWFSACTVRSIPASSSCALMFPNSNTSNLCREGGGEGKQMGGERGRERAYQPGIFIPPLAVTGIMGLDA